MILYFIEHTDDNKINFYTCEMKDRIDIWKNHPKAKEIPKKTFLKFKELINKKDDTTVR